MQTAVNIVEFLESIMVPCYFKLVFGINCPGCGLQRSIIFLLKGELWASIKMYPPLLPIAFTLGLYFFNKQYSYPNQEFIFKVVAWALCVLVTINFLVKFGLEHM